MNRISLTPLIDVVFILLFFFMLATQFDMRGGIPLGFASTHSATAAPDKTMMVRLQADGQLLVNNERLTLSSLDKILVVRLEVNPGLSVLLYADDHVMLQSLVSLHEHMARVGVNTILYRGS